MSNWQPIETPPPYGKLCLIWSKDCKIPAIATYHVGHEEDGIFNQMSVFIGLDDDSYYPEVIYWMPMPEAPV